VFLIVVAAGTILYAIPAAAALAAEGAAVAGVAEEAEVISLSAYRAVKASAVVQ
jgi:hypothetical protein